LRGELDAILTKAMQRDPQRRYATADALAQDIERYLQGETVSARPDSVAYRMHKALKRHWVGVSAVTAVLIAVLSGSAVALGQAQRAARASERERMVREFVADVFRINARVNPVNAAMRPASPVSLLEGGAQLIQQRFAGQPDMQAELFAVVGGVFSDMGAYKLAADYATHRIEALDLIHADNVEQAKALLTLAQALFDDRKYPDAEVRLRRAIELAGKDLAIRLDALALLARVQLSQNNLQEAEATAQQLELHIKAGVASPIVKAWSVFIRAEILDWQNHFEQAIPLLKQAIDQALVAEGPLSETAISMRISAALSLIEHTDFKLGREYFNQAEAAMRQLGGAHEVHADYSAAVFTVSLYQYQALPLPEVTEKVSGYRKKLASSELPIPVWYVPNLDSFLAVMRIMSGDFKTGLPLYELSRAEQVKAFGYEYHAVSNAINMGLAMAATGRHESADQFYRKALERVRARGAPLQPSDASLYQYISENLLMWGKLADAEKFLDAAPKFEGVRGDGPGRQMFEKYLLWERAALLIDQANPRSAIRILLANPPENAAEGDESGYDISLGEALCLDHQTSKGLPLLRKGEALMDSLFTYPASPYYGQLWGLLGQCQLDSGDPAGARLYAAKARKVFVTQPDVSPYFKKPLEKLERQLGIHSATSKG
jgi:serine/threonine-protein kinase